MFEYKDITYLYGHLWLVVLVLVLALALPLLLLRLPVALVRRTCALTLMLLSKHLVVSSSS